MTPYTAAVWRLLRALERIFVESKITPALKAESAKWACTQLYTQRS